MPFNREDKHLINSSRQEEGYNSRRFLQYFQTLYVSNDDDKCNGHALALAVLAVTAVL